ncbi:DUF5131 family protein [Maribacter dokdonensis]|uniref:DUF5131 family protein n=1 Tax=Maribacter dokdonensis TaxID=320912 RepID=UPI002AB19D28|nr:DUF5131 family protein [Maribacter dokdonensis]
MAKDSKIEWTQNTANLWWGCTAIHEGCGIEQGVCYAQELSEEYGNDLWGKDKLRREMPRVFRNLDKWQEQAEVMNDLQVTFVGSMMDIFEESKGTFSHNVPYGPNSPTTGDLRKKLFDYISMGRYNNLLFLFLTKRPKQITRMIPSHWLTDMPKNVWFGTSVSSMKTWRWAEHLKKVPTKNLFLSVEPQMDNIDNIDLTGIGWVIQGGQSGRDRKPFNLEWAYTMRRICKEQEVPYFFKQIDKVKKIPSDLLIREFPRFEKGNLIEEFHGIKPTEVRDTVKLSSYKFTGYRNAYECLLQETFNPEEQIIDRKKEPVLYVEGSEMDTIWVQDKNHFFETVRLQSHPAYKPVIRLIGRYCRDSNTMYFTNYLGKHHIVELTMSEAIAIAKKCKQALDCGDGETSVKFNEHEFRIVSDYNPPICVVSSYKQNYMYV